MVNFFKGTDTPCWRRKALIASILRLRILRIPSINGALMLEWLNKSLLSSAKICLPDLFVAGKVTFLILS